MSQENKALFERLITEVFGRGNLNVVDELIAQDVIDHDPVPGQEPGVAGLKAGAKMFRSAFPDLNVTVEDLIAEGDKVVARVTTTGTHKGDFMGIPATGRSISVKEFHIVRILNGKAVEHWGLEDSLGMMQQLGVIPEEAPAS